MTPVHCRVAHAPEQGLFGDCIRACVASLMDVDPEAVPHFVEDNPTDGMIVRERINSYLASVGHAAFWAVLPGDLSLDELLDHMREANENTYYMLFGRTASGNGHVVIARGGEIDFDPSWIKTPILRPDLSGTWPIMVVARG